RDDGVKGPVLQTNAQAGDAGSCGKAANLFRRDAEEAFGRVIEVTVEHPVFAWDELLCQEVRTVTVPSLLKERAQIGAILDDELGAAGVCSHAIRVGGFHHQRVRYV